MTMLVGWVALTNDQLRLHILQVIVGLPGKILQRMIMDEKYLRRSTVQTLWHTAEKCYIRALRFRE